MGLILTACGGGAPSASFVPSPTPLTPQITVYGTSFILSDTVISAMSSTQGTLVNCPTSGTEIELKNTISRMVTVNTMTSYGITVYAYLTGNFSLPNGGQLTCNTTGITGTISRQRFFDGSNNLIFDLTNLNLPANSMQSGWQSYWKAILAQTGQLNLTGSSAATITCTNSQNSQITIPLNTAGDISSQIRNCVN
jgi:5-enolpyruvylshikimate-3-phosphate synthase